MKRNKALFVLLAISVSIRVEAQFVENVTAGVVEFLSSEDIDYTSALADHRLTKDDYEFRVSLISQRTEIDYESVGFPIDIVTDSADRSENYYSGSFEISKQLQQRFKGIAILDLFDGFSRHQSIWLDEYYRQFWTDVEIEGDRYETPDPGGLGLVLGADWEWIPSNAFVRMRLGYSKQTIAPGYDLSVEGDTAGQLVRGIEDLDVWSAELSLEHLSSRTLRWNHSLSAVETTGRKVRYGVASALSAALSESWILRLSGQYSREGSDVEASLLRSSLIYAPNETWSFSVTGSYYKDNGEIEQSNLATDAAPGVIGYRYFLGASWTSLDATHQITAQVGVYEQNYDELGLDLRFAPLYSSRNWDFFKIGYSINW